MAIPFAVPSQSNPSNGFPYGKTLIKNPIFK